MRREYLDGLTRGLQRYPEQMADMEVSEPSVGTDLPKEVPMSDTDSDLAEDMRFEKLVTSDVEDIDHESKHLAQGMDGVLAAFKATTLGPHQTILAYAKQLINEQARQPQPAKITLLGTAKHQKLHFIQ